MQLKTVLNRVHKIKGFVYERTRFEGEEIVVEVRPRRGSRPICSGCGQPRPGYDRLAARRFQFVPWWALGVVFVYAMRRVACPSCGVVVEQVPWADGKRQLTRAYAVFLARWGRRLSWKEVATVFHTSWETVFRAVARVVSYGLQHRSFEGVTAIGIDEVQYQRGHRFLTVVYQLNASCRRLRWVGQNRSARTLLAFFKLLGTERSARLEFVCTDMWRAYLKVIRRKLPQAIHLLDRCHVVARLNKAVDQVRRAEAAQLRREGYEPVLKRSRWCFLKRPENLTEKPQVKLKDLMQYALRSVRAYLLKESFQLLWGYPAPYWAGWFLDRWVARAQRSRLPAIRKVARTIRKHRELILNGFRARKEFSSGIVEGLNYRIKLTMRKAYGYRSLEVAEIAIYHALGRLPEPKLAHEFC